MKKLLLIFIPVFSISQVNYNLNWLDQFEGELNFKNYNGCFSGAYSELHEDDSWISNDSYFIGFGNDSEIAYLEYEDIDYGYEGIEKLKIVIKQDGVLLKEMLLWENTWWEHEEYYSEEEYYNDEFCKDPDAFNYCSDCYEEEYGSCCYVEGCMDEMYFEYNPDACHSDWSCDKRKVGCTELTAYNYCETCIEDNGSCIAVVEGCTEEGALNYNEEANEDNGSCQYSINYLLKDKRLEINTFLSDNFIDPNPIFYFFEENENEIIFSSPSNSRDLPSTNLTHVKEYSNAGYLDEFNISEELFSVAEPPDTRVRKSIGLAVYCTIDCRQSISDLFYAELFKIPNSLHNKEYSLLFYSSYPDEQLVVLVVAFWEINEKTGQKDVVSIQSIPIEVSGRPGGLNYYSNKEDFLKSFITYKDYVNNGGLENYKMAISLLEEEGNHHNSPDSYDHLYCLYLKLARSFNKDEEYNLVISNYKKSIEHKVFSHYPGCWGHSKKEVYQELANIFYNKKEYSKSAKYYTKILNLNNELTDYEKAALYSDRGRAYAKSDYSSDLKNAVADLLFAENIYKEIGHQTEKQSLCFFYSGWASYKMKDYQSSIDYYTKAIELRPNDDSAHNNRGICYAAVSLYKFAINDYDKAIDLSPKSGLYYSNKANALKSLGEPYCDFYKKACELGYQDACGACY